MGNELADAIRDELNRLALARFGTLDIAATELGIPYKTLYRALTKNGKDRTQRVTLDFVLELADKLGVDIAYLYSRASTANVGGLTETGDPRRQSDYARVADETTEADETGEDIDTV